MVDLKVGDIILVHGGSFLARGIQFFMNIYRKRLGLPKRKLYNHVAVVVDLYGELYVAEAHAKGVQVLPNAVQYVESQDCLVLTWAKPLTKSEQSLFSREAVKYALIPHRYDVLNFFFQMKYILTGMWRCPVGSKSVKLIYCSELGAIVMDKVRGSFNGQTWDKNPLDIELCDELRAVV